MIKYKYHALRNVVGGMCSQFASLRFEYIVSKAIPDGDRVSEITGHPVNVKIFCYLTGSHKPLKRNLERQEVDFRPGS